MPAIVIPYAAINSSRRPDKKVYKKITNKPAALRHLPPFKLDSEKFPHHRSALYHTVLVINLKHIGITFMDVITP